MGFVLELAVTLFPDNIYDLIILTIPFDYTFDLLLINRYTSKLNVYIFRNIYDICSF